MNVNTLQATIGISIQNRFVSRNSQNCTINVGTNTRHVCPYFEWISHDDSKYRNELQKFWFDLENFETCMTRIRTKSFCFSKFSNIFWTNTRHVYTYLNAFLMTIPNIQKLPNSGILTFSCTVLWQFYAHACRIVSINWLYVMFESNGEFYSLYQSEIMLRV